MINRARVLKAADKYVRQGKLEAAVKEFLKLIQDNPRDVATINRVGDLYSKLGKKEQAIQQFSRIAEYYTDEGVQRRREGFKLSEVVLAFLVTRRVLWFKVQEEKLLDRAEIYEPVRSWLSSVSSG